MDGCTGKILRVNLTKGRITEDAWKEDVARKFLGGRGLGAKILFEELKPGVDLAPEIGLAPTIAPRYRIYTGPEKAKLVKIGEDLFAAYDSLVVCKFTMYPWGFH